jgi:hypothetical protein
MEKDLSQDDRHILSTIIKTECLINCGACRVWTVVRFMALDIDIIVINYEYYEKVNRKKNV